MRPVDGPSVPPERVRHVYLATCVLAALIGVAHTGVGLVDASALTQARMWFVGSGLYMVLSAVLGMLHAAGEAGSRPLTILVRANHALILAFAISTGSLGRPSLAEWILVLVAFGGMALLSWSRPRGRAAA